MLVVLVLLAVLALLAVATFAVDPILSARVEQAASARLSVPFTGGARLRLRHAPFLTQALRGRYREVHVVGTGLQLGEFGRVALDATLSDVHLPLRAVLSRRVDELPCGRVTGRMVAPYEAVAGAAKIPGLRLAYRDGRVRATAALPLTQLSGLIGLVGLGTLASLTGAAQQFTRIRGDAVLFIRNGDVCLRLENLDVGSLPITSLVASQLVRQFDVVIPLPPLPWGLQLTAITAEPHGLVLDAAAAGTVLRKEPAGG